MKILVCVNHVPDSAAKIAVAGNGTTIDKTGVTFALNPYDEFAVEEGLRLKEKNGGEVIAVSVGGDSNKETLRKALAMGVDRAVLLKDDAARDSFAVAEALAAYAKEISPDVILTGKQSIDFDDAAVGVMLGEILGIPSVSITVKLEIAGTQVTAEREIEGGRETVAAALPAVITCQKGLNEPRYPSLKGIMASKSKPIEEKQPAPAKNRTEIVGMKNPPMKAGVRIVGTGADAVPELVRLLHEEAKVI